MTSYQRLPNKHICKICGEANLTLNYSHSNHYECYLQDKRNNPSKLGYYILEFLDGLEKPISMYGIHQYLDRVRGAVANACYKLEGLGCIKRTTKGCTITTKGIKALKQWRKNKV